VFVYTSVSETFGNVVNEALWTGLPVVALHDRMGVSHQVVHGENGFLVPPDRVDTDREFARRVLALTSSREARRRMGQNAANLARQVSHPDVVIRRFERIYEASCQHAEQNGGASLKDASSFVQRRELVRHTSKWARYNYLLLLMANTVGKLGLGRKDHVSTITTASEPAPARMPAAAMRPREMAVEAAE
jgi:hypothetical protein